MSSCGENVMLAVLNFASDQQQTHYSILEVIAILPMAQCMGNDMVNSSVLPVPNNFDESLETFEDDR
jgi:hypothetical protein